MVSDDWRLQDDPRLPLRGRIVWDPQGGADPEPTLAHCLDAMQDWEEALLWVTACGIWPSSEDWPAYYSFRGARGERREIHVAPGHLFDQREVADLAEFLTVALRFGWDAHLLPVIGHGMRRRLGLCHDGWVELRTGGSIVPPWEIWPV